MSFCLLTNKFERIELDAEVSTFERRVVLLDGTLPLLNFSSSAPIRVIDAVAGTNLTVRDEILS